MRANRRRDTGPELALRRELHGRGLRYRVDFAPVKGLRCKPDIVFTRAKLVVFVDGCFWHRCPHHATQPRANGDWWREKLDANVRRDRRHDLALAAAGWRVLRVWEHEPTAVAAVRIHKELHELGAPLPEPGSAECHSPVAGASRSRPAGFGGGRVRQG